MLRKIGVALILIFLVMPFVLAINVDITVKGLQNHDITVNIFNLETEDLVKSLVNKVTDSSGLVKFTYSTDKGIIGVVAIERLDGKIVKLKSVQNYPTTDPIYIDLTEADKPVVTPKVNTSVAQPAVNTTPATPVVIANTTNTSSTVEETKDTKNNTQEELKDNSNETKNTLPITGNVVNTSSGFNINWKYVLYGILSIFIIGLLIVSTAIIVARVKRDPDAKMFLNAKNRPGLSFGGTMTHSEERRLREAEHKLKLAQDEIYRIKLKKENKIREAEKRIEHDKMELDRLRRERF